MPVVLVCDNCKREFSVKPSHAEGRRHCSQKCYGISQRKVQLTQAELLDLYVVQQKSMADIGEMEGVSLQTICNLLEENGILRRGLSEAHRAMYAGPRGEKRIEDRLATLEKNHGTRNPGGQHGNFKSGFKDDLQVRVRSGWEANVLRWLSHQGIEWEYEPKRFYFPIKRGTMSYLPDVYLPESDCWIEIKGNLTDKDRTRMKRFKKYCPVEFSKLVAITGGDKQKATIFFREMGVPIYANYIMLDREFKDVIPHWGE